MSPSSCLRFPVRPGLIALFQLACLALVAEVPQTLPFQGRVSVDGVPFNGTGQFKFALLNASDTVVWNSAADSSPADGEPDTPVTLAVSKGLYSVLLGQGMDPLSATLFSTHGDLRLRAWFNDGTHGFQRLNPDQPVGSVAYALRSQSAADAEVAQLAQSVANGAILESKLADNAVSNLKLASDPGSLAKVSAGLVASTAGNLKVNLGTLYGVNPSDSFQYNSKSMGHYALGWMQDSWYSGGPTLWMSGYGGLKFFAHGSLAMSIGSGGNTVISGDTTIGKFGDDRLLTVEGRVGIGVSNPDAPLSIRRDSANSFFGYCITLADRNGTPWWKLGASNAGQFSIGAAGLRDNDISILRENGNVGIGTIPFTNVKLRVAGDLYVGGVGEATGGFHSLSDSRLKTNIDRIEGALARVDSLRGVSFHWRQDIAEHPRPKGRQIGFIAQDVAAVLPELVHTNADGYLSVNYDGVAPVLVEAVHEMKQQFDARLAEKNAEIQGLQTRLSKLESALASLLTRDPVRRDDRPDQ